jgi:hypothetical protein
MSARPKHPARKDEKLLHVLSQCLCLQRLFPLRYLLTTTQQPLPLIA